MKFILNEVEHEAGNKNCITCRPGYPKTCPCGGQIHLGYQDKSSAEARCDTCGRQEK